MEKSNTFFSDETVLSTPQPNAASTVNQKKVKRHVNDNLIDLSTNSFDSNGSLGIISIQSDDPGPYIDNLQLKESRRDTAAYVNQQRALASLTLQNRGSKISSLPSRYLRPSEISTSYDSSINLLNGSTVSESDLLKETGVNNTSTPRSSISPTESCNRFDIAETMARMSLEIRHPNMSLSTALQKAEEAYQKVRHSSSVQSEMFRPAEEAESQLLADEASWKREKELPVDKVDFTVDNFDTSRMSISAFFKQRSEDISNIIPASSRKSSIISNPLSVSLESDVSSLPENRMSDYDDIPQKESLSISKIAQILQGSDDTPTKVLDYLLKHYPGGSRSSGTNHSSISPIFSSIKEENQENYISPTSSEKTNNDREAFHASTLTSDKENFNSMNVNQQSTLGKMSSSISKSITSLRSTSSLSNLPGGKLPIETTHCELVWGCVRAGKTETKQFTIRNRSSNKLRLQCTTSGQIFRIIQERGEDISNSVKLMLYAHETKSISVIFNPITDGAAVDEIVFSPCDPNLQQTRKQSIKLYGYGGIGTVEFKKNILKDTSGRHWLSLGNIFEQSTISETITIFNKGTLSVFAFLDYVSKDFAFSNVSVNPHTIILAPNEERDIQISCKATKEDMKYIKNSVTTSVFEIGIIKIISGPEPIRGRIRRVCKLAMERNLEQNALCNRLQQDIPGETIPGDVVKCRESVNSMAHLLKGLVQKEIVIMLEKDLDFTLVPALTDETSMFQSLFHETTIIDKINKIDCKLEPSCLILTPSKLQDCVFLLSQSDTTLHFEVSVPDDIEITPQSGYIIPHATKVLDLKIKNLAGLKQNEFTVLVNVEGDVLSTAVKIICI